MKLSPMQLVHIDLSSTREGPESDGRPMLAMLWWKDLPLGMVPGTADEAPFSPAFLEANLARMVAEQRAARDSRLGAPLQGTYEGNARRALTVADARQTIGTLEWLESVSALPLTSAEQLTVVVCTRDRVEALARCLDRLESQRSPPGEIVVVDNSRGGNARPACQGRRSVRYVHEAEPGLSRARNAGILAAKQQFIAFTDDDVEPHPNWTSDVVRALEESGAEAMTGLVLPSSLDTPAQVFFQMRMGGFGERFVPVLYGSDFYEKTRTQGAHVWRIGAGANMAFRREVFEKLGMFDTRLGAGASGCSEDSEMWYRIIATGGTCHYEPRAVVYHHHRESWPALRQQMRAYLKGHVSALVVQADRFGDRGNLRRIFRQLPSYLFRELVEGIQSHEKERLQILAEEVRGWLGGLPYVMRGNWRRSAPPLPFEDGRRS